MDDDPQPYTKPELRYFEFDHLHQGPLRQTSSMVATLAYQMREYLPDSAETQAGLRKLLEAKDCFVRAALDLVPPKEVYQFIVDDNVKEV
jgi:hypothetical protein